MKYTILFLFTALIFCLGCSEDTVVNEAPYVLVKILQPDSGQIIRDSVLRVITSLDKNCGCTARVEFSVDGVRIAVDDTPAYYCDWDIRAVHGERTILAHGIVEGRAEGFDSVRVTINP